MTGTIDSDIGAAESRAAAMAFGALVLGATAMGISPVFVRLAEVGPFASAFWRVALALPVLYAWMQFDARRAGGSGPDSGPGPGIDRNVLLVGVLFAGDLFFWHLAIMNTTVANATFLAALAPVMVVFGSWLVLRQSVGIEVVLGLGLGVAGAAFLLGSSYNFAPGNLVGDGYGLITAAFFGAYILAVKPARRTFSAGRLIFLSSLVTSAILLVVALVMEPTLFPPSLKGIVMLLALALVSHVGGQGLLAIALGHLPAPFSSVVILLEGVAAAVFGWLILGEHLTWLQLAGSAAIFGGIWIARPRRRRVVEPAL